MKNLNSSNAVIPEFFKSYMFWGKPHFLRLLERGANNMQCLFMFTQAFERKEFGWRIWASVAHHVRTGIQMLPGASLIRFTFYNSHFQRNSWNKHCIFLLRMHTQLEMMAWMVHHKQVRSKVPSATVLGTTLDCRSDALLHNASTLHSVPRPACMCLS